MRWQEEAACRGVRAPLWDAAVHGETAEQREARHHEARNYCRRCPVALACWEAVDWQWDEGIRAGMLLPEKKTAARAEHGRPRTEIRHGTEAGHAAHKRRGEHPCWPCREADRLAHAERHAKKRRAS
jgi:hypothetical protein